MEKKEIGIIYLKDRKDIITLKDKTDIKAEGGITYTKMPMITKDGKPLIHNVGDEIKE